MSRLYNFCILTLTALLLISHEKELAQRVRWTDNLGFLLNMFANPVSGFYCYC